MFVYLVLYMENVVAVFNTEHKAKAYISEAGSKNHHYEKWRIE